MCVTDVRPERRRRKIERYRERRKKKEKRERPGTKVDTRAD